MSTNVCLTSGKHRSKPPPGGYFARARKSLLPGTDTGPLGLRLTKELALGGPIA